MLPGPKSMDQKEITDEEILDAIIARMWERRKREQSRKRAQFTMCYAVSVITGHCYVGYNMDKLKKTEVGSCKCAENRAVHVATTYGEALESLVLFTMNNNSEYFHPCKGCQGWIWKARGYLRNYNGYWQIATRQEYSQWQESRPFTKVEAKILYEAGLHEFDEDFEDIRLRHPFEEEGN